MVLSLNYYTLNVSQDVLVDCCPHFTVCEIIIMDYLWCPISYFSADIRIYMLVSSRSNMHACTHKPQIHELLMTGWSNEKKMTDQYAEEKRWVFSFDLSKLRE